MKRVTVSIDRIVIDFTDVYGDFFNEFHKRICHYYGVRMTVGERGFQYRIRINTGEHFLHISYKLVFAPKTRKNTLRIEVYPKSLFYFRHWLEQIQRANLTRASFRDAQVAGDFTNAVLEDVDFTGADLRGSRMLKQDEQRVVLSEEQRSSICWVEA